MLPGSYGETLELIAGHTRHLRLFTLPVKEATAPYSRPQILLLDSCTTASAFEGALRCIEPKFELLIFDTTCFAGSSGRIRRVLRWARKYSIPVVMVRSHTKLDSLGAEYGRLGSAVFVPPDKNDRSSSLSKFEKLKAETRDAVRLLGNAALPAHFPPYVGRPSYRALTNRRVAAILRNGRRSALHFASALHAEVNFAHGLYLTLDSAQPLDERTARAAASQMSNYLRREGFPIRHAGSFGFDFAATEWFQHSTTKRYSVRVAVADLPTGLWDDLSSGCQMVGDSRRHVWVRSRTDGIAKIGTLDCKADCRTRRPAPRPCDYPKFHGCEKTEALRPIYSWPRWPAEFGPAPAISPFARTTDF